MLTKNQILFGAAFLLLGSGVALGATRGEPALQKRAVLHTDAAHEIAPQELATWVIEGRRDFTIVDLRGVEQYQAGHIRAAVSCANCHKSKEEGRKATFVDLSKKVVVYTETDKEEATLPKILMKDARIYRLKGGWEGWKQEVLAPVKLDGLKDRDAIQAAQKREAVRAFFAGETPVAAPPPNVPVEPIKRSGAHKQAASEGC